MAALAAQYTHAKAMKEHCATFADLMNPALLKPGCSMPPGQAWMESADLDRTKVPAAFHFVKDAGIYLMSNGSPALLDPQQVLRDPNTQHSLVVYAEGYGPDNWDGCREAVGGDDFAEVVGLDWYEQALANQEEFLHLAVGSNSIQLVISPKYRFTAGYYAAEHHLAGQLGGFFLHTRGKPKSQLLEPTEAMRQAVVLGAGAATLEWMKQCILSPARPSGAVKTGKKKRKQHEPGK